MSNQGPRLVAFSNGNEPIKEGVDFQVNIETFVFFNIWLIVSLKEWLMMLPGSFISIPQPVACVINLFTLEICAHILNGSMCMCDDLQSMVSKGEIF